MAKHALPTDPNVTADVFGYLDALRDSGITNMFGARPYIEQEFPDLPMVEAKSCLTAWMNTFNGDSTPAVRAAMAYKEQGA